MKEIKPRKRIVENELPDGFLFGQVGTFPRKETPRFAELVKNVKRERKWSVAGGWDYHSTSISDYVDTSANFKLDEYLASKISAHNEVSLEPVRILDVGIGTGNQWMEFARKHSLEIGRDFEICGTSFTRNGVIDELKEKVKICTANNVHLKFRGSKPFDFVVSHYGMHEMEETGMESAFRTLKKGGELITSGIWTRVVPKLVPGFENRANLLKSHPAQTHMLNGTEWFLHLKKK